MVAGHAQLVCGNAQQQRQPAGAIEVNAAETRVQMVKSLLLIDCFRSYLRNDAMRVEVRFLKSSPHAFGR